MSVITLTDRSSQDLKDMGKHRAGKDLDYYLKFHRRMQKEKQEAATSAAPSDGIG